MVVVSRIKAKGEVARSALLDLEPDIRTTARLAMAMRLALSGLIREGYDEGGAFEGLEQLAVTLAETSSGLVKQWEGSINVCGNKAD